MSSLPAVPEAFEWRQASWGPALVCRPLLDVAPHVFATRDLELTGGSQGWTALAGALHVAPGHVASLDQVHGATVIALRRGETPAERPRGDGLATSDPTLALAVRTADCAALLLADRRSGGVAAVHAGWRGTALGIAPAAVSTMGQAFDTHPEDLVVAIGPTIGSCCYEVGPELVDEFAKQRHERYLIDRWFLAPPPRRGERDRPALRLDIPGANRDQLVLAGVPENQIHIAGLCTAMHLDVLTSYRAEREAAGRLVAAIRAPD